MPRLPLLLLALAVGTVSGARPHPQVRQVRAFAASSVPTLTTSSDIQPPRTSDMGGEEAAVLQRLPSDMSHMSCGQANTYMADVERRFSSVPHNLEDVCVSLRLAMKRGMPRCPEFKVPHQLFSKLLNVCKIISNDGDFTCKSAADCGHHTQQATRHA